MIKFLQLFLSLTILITLHEFGHYYFAKRFKCRVEKFYLFFDFLFPFAGLLNFSLFKKKIGDTEYGLGWFPFGGYVQIAGMVDEQMDKSIIESEPKPWELRSKPAWQRLLVMMGGIIVNVILGFFIFWMVLLVWGKETIPVDKLKYGIAVDSTAYKMGLRDGDYVVSIDKKTVNSLQKVPVMIIMDKAHEMEVKRDGQILTVPISEDHISQILKNLKRTGFIRPRVPIEIDSLQAGSNAMAAGLKAGDKPFAVNDAIVPFHNNFIAELHKHKKEKVQIKYVRGKDTLSSQVQVDTLGAIGFYNASEKYIPVETQHFSFFGALGQSFKDGWENIAMQAKQFVVIFTVKDAHQQVGGFYTMYKQMNEEWVWRDFWVFTGLLSLVLAFMNFLPIPMLDGGYILFILIEMIFRRKVSDKVLYYANYVGLFFILGLMLYANTDWLREWMNK